MGYGAFDSDFGGVGDTFTVSGPIPTAAGYAAYAEECRADGDEPLDEEGWREQEVEDFESELLGTLRAASADLGLALSRRGPRGGYPAAGFDDDFTLVAEASPVAVGFRQWQHDYVVGVAPAAGMLDALRDVEGNAAAFLELGRLPESYEALYDTVRSAVQDYVRLRLMANGIECRFRTSGYTSAAYEQPADPKAETARLRAVAEAGIKRLDRQPDDALDELDGAGRVAFLAGMRAAFGEDEAPFRVVVPVFDADFDDLWLFTPGEPDANFTRKAAPHERAWLAALPPGEGGRAALPEGAEAEALVARIQGAEDSLVVTAAEYAAATGEDCVVSWDGGAVEMTLAEAARAPSP